MSQNPKQVWQRLPAKQQKEILIELLNICQEITHEYIKTSNTAIPNIQSNTQSNYLCSTASIIPNNNQSKKPEIAMYI